MRDPAPPAGLPEPRPAPVSACIVCRNEADRLPDCLASIRWVDEVVVMDLRSDDGSAEVARRLGARVVERDPVSIVERVRNEVAALASHDWILVLDPDERVSPGLAAALRRAAGEEGRDAVVMPRSNWDLGYPPGNPKERYEPQLRMYRRDRVSWPEVPNALPVVEASRRLDLPARDDLVLVHLRNRTVAEALDRVVRYAPAEGRAWRDAGVEFSAGAMLRDLGTQTYRQLVYGRAWRDGVPGLLRVGLILAFRFYTWVAFWEASGAGRTARDDRTLRRLGLLLEPPRAVLRLGQETADLVARVLRRRR